MNDITPLQQAYSDYSDFHKDVHGIRPRWASGWTMEMYEEGMKTLHREWEERKEQNRNARILRKLKASIEKRSQAEQKQFEATILTQKSVWSIGQLISL